MRNFLLDFGLAWRLLTVIPLPGWPEDFQRPGGRVAGYYPLVGLVLGVILVGVEAGLRVAGLPAGVAISLVLVSWVGLTGMLHLDGFMDSCDGLLPPRDPARRLEIMRDSRVGAFGVVGVLLLLLLKFNALLAISVNWRGAALIAAPVLARAAVTWTMARYPLARRGGLAHQFVAGLGWRHVGLALLVALAVTAGLFGLWSLVLGGAAWLSAFLVARLALARIGGLSGDVYGAVCEVAEAGLLVTIAVITFN